MLNIKHNPSQALIDTFKTYREELASQIVLKFPLSLETQQKMKDLEKVDQQLDWLENEHKGNVQGGPDFDPEILKRLGLIEDVKALRQPVDPSIVAQTMEDWRKISETKDETLAERKKAIESVKQQWQKTHNPLKTPWRDKIDASKREYKIEKRAEELFRSSGLYSAVMKAFKDYARIELMYIELRDITTPPIDIDDQEAADFDGLDFLEAERLGLNTQSKSTSAPRHDPAI